MSCLVWFGAAQPKSNWGARVTCFSTGPAYLWVCCDTWSYNSGPSGLLTCRFWNVHQICSKHCTGLFVRLSSQAACSGQFLRCSLISPALRLGIFHPLCNGLHRTHVWCFFLRSVQREQSWITVNLPVSPSNSWCRGRTGFYQRCPWGLAGSWSISDQRYSDESYLPVPHVMATN